MVSGKLTEETRVNPAPGQIDCLKADSSRLRLPQRLWELAGV